MISNLFRQGNNNPSQEDVQSCQKLLTEMHQGFKQLEPKTEALERDLNNMQFSEGISFFDSKNLLFLDYLQQLHYYFLFRLSGQSLVEGEGKKLYEKMIYDKTLLMKLPMVQRKLEYKVSKMMKQSTRIKTADDPLKFKARPDQLSKERTTENIDRKEKKYIPAKIAPVLMEKDEVQKRKQLKQERRKSFLRRQLRGALLDENEQQQPEDRNLRTPFEIKMMKRQQDKIRYEQENFVRLPETKKQRQMRKRLEKQSRRDDVGDLSELDRINQLLKYEKLIQEDAEKERKVQRTLGIDRRKKIKKIRKQ